MSEPIEIRGGAGPEEAAAIAAAIAFLQADEWAVRSRPQTVPRKSAWVQSWRPREIHAPLPSHVYDAEAAGLAEDNGAEEQRP